ncbi:DNA polymerase I [Oceanimonas baumannii]|uniref:DNA polymerase I n=1 Tax=Oceanimonas baumannii TaxID=129578 RepID=A0A235CIM3_9GAMM|nr:DNA polymerase I [Oceanimonas baumannii]OYD24249.1 DNA polymerase I [Oceanimonas baumannii]TDW58978.1 DNA polymerase I [Oceanimonas baumannii]
MVAIPAKPLILVDGSSYLYRAYFASQQADLRTRDGRPTGAIRVVTNMLRSLYKQFPDSRVAVVFDAKGKTFRDEIYAEYKAHRPSMPDDLREQIKPIHDIIRAMGLPLLIEEGVEADDVIGTLARQATEQQLDVVISTGDKDMAQLVSDHVLLMDTMKNSFLDRNGVVEKFGVPPELIIDLLALVGDKVDNIPGMPGVGEKTALALLQGLGSIDDIAANTDKIAELGFRGSKSFAGKFAEHEEQVRLSYTLATIKTDVQLDVGPADLKQNDPDTEALRALYQEFEFRNLLAELDPDTETETPAAPALETDYQLVTEQAQLDEWIKKLEAAPLLAFDTETTSLSYRDARVVGVSFAVEAGQAAYVPFGHDYLDAPEQLSEEIVLGALKPLLEDNKRIKLGQNLKYDINVLKNHGIELSGALLDTMLESYALNSVQTRHDMDSMASFFLNHSTTSFESIAGKGAKQLTFNQIPLEQAGPYAAEDADITLRLHHHLAEKLAGEPELERVFNDIEMPLVPILAKMEYTGVRIDGKRLAAQSDEIAKRLKELEQEAFELAGEPFNLSSTKQLGEILFTKLELPVIKKTPKGAPSTAEEVLQELALDYPLPKLLMEYRALSKLKSTYTDKLPQMMNEHSGRVHTSYHQANTATGRLSSSDPNLQNIPIRTPEGRRIRQAFVAEPGYKLVAADYSQIELRIMAHLSQDKGLLTAFAEGQDIHRATAAEVFGVAVDDVTGEQRRRAKAINFGLIYGMSAFGLARQLGIGRNEAQNYMNIYFERYPGVLRYMEDTREQASERGYVSTLFGRRLYLPEIKSKNGARRKGAERAAINAPMQGTAADIIKKAMVLVSDWISELPAGDVRMLMQVHDELVFEIREDKTEGYRQKICELMQQAASLDVPLLVEAGVGDNWDQAH